jgi:hypothetical protein
MGIKRMQIYKLLILLVFIISTSFSQTIPPEDPLINIVQSQGVIGLNLSQPGSGEQIAYFLINSNSSTGFIIKISLSNRGNFRNGVNSIPMTSLVLNKSSGIIGTGLTEPNNLDVLAVVSSGGEYSWNPGNTPVTATTNYMVELKADWEDPVGKLAGFYFETITVTISVGL